MAWLKKIPWLSLIILLLSYAVEAWMYGIWATKLLESGTILAHLTDSIRLGVLYGAAVAIISFLVVVFTSPISLIAISLDGWLKYDGRAFISIFMGAFAFTIIVQRVDYFARFLVLASAALLVKLDLQLAGYNRWLCSLILVFFCCLGFTGGILTFYVWG